MKELEQKVTVETVELVLTALGLNALESVAEIIVVAVEKAVKQSVTMSETMIAAPTNTVNW